MNLNEWQDRWTSLDDGFERSTLMGKERLAKMVEAASQEVFRPLSVKIKASLNTGFAQAEAVGDKGVAKLQALVSSDIFAQNIFSESIQRWLVAHPLWAWSFGHPVLALAIALTSLILLITGLQWLLNPKTWLQILSFPVRFVARRLTPSHPTQSKLPRLASSEAQPAEHPLADQSLDIPAILARLQSLQQEQAMLHQQLQTLFTEAAKSESIDRHLR